MNRIGDWAIILVVTVDAALLALIELFYLPLRFDGVFLPDLGSFPFPITVVLAGITNPFLTRIATRLVPRLLVGGLPIAVWFIVTIGLTLGGPSGTFAVYPDWRILLLLAAGTLPSAVALGSELGKAPGSTRQMWPRDNERITS